jgi:L-amino acid N-acyltransferase YncA
MLQVRPADPDRDAGACAAIYSTFVTDTVVSFENVAPSADEMAGRIIRTWTAYPWLVAELDGAVAGFAYASRHRERASYRWAADVSVYVAPGHHRRGVGRALYARLFELLGDQGLQVLIAGITLPNAASVALHESLGFRPVGVYRRIGYKLGAWCDVGWWQLELVPATAGPPPEPRPPLAPGGEDR